MPLLQTIGNATARAWRRYGPTSAAADYELISTTVLGSSAASVTFSGLGTSAAAYKHLQIRAVARDSVTIYGGTYLNMRFNSDSGSNYSQHRLYGDGGSLTSTASTSQTSMFVGRMAGSSSSNTTIYSPAVIDLLDFSSSSKNKTIRSLNSNQMETFIMFLSGAWYSTAAVTSITLASSNGTDLATGSRFSLYGLK